MLTHDDVAALTASFDWREHEFLRGAIYLTEQAVTRRLDAVDPSWSFTVKTVEHRADKCVVYAALTVCGVTRESNGMDVSEYRKDSERVPENEVNQREKAALTDVLKRCARLFGIGRYMLDMPRKGEKGAVADFQSLRAWLASTFAESEQDLQTFLEKNAPSAPPSPVAPEPCWSEAEAKTWAQSFRDGGWTIEGILHVLGVKKLSEWCEGTDAATARMVRAEGVPPDDDADPYSADSLAEQDAASAALQDDPFESDRDLVAADKEAGS